MAITIPRIGVEQSQLAVQSMATPEAGISQAAGVIDVTADIQMRKEKRDSDAFTAQRTTELMLESQDLLNQVSLETEDPNKITETFLERYNELYNSKLEGAPNELAKRVLDEKNQQIRAGLGRAAIETQANEVQAKRMSDLDTSLNKIYTTVRTTGNYELGQLALEEALAGAESYTLPSQLDALKKKAVETNKTAYLDRLFEGGDINAVRKLINNPEFASDLGVKGVGAYRDAIKAEEKRQADANNINNIIKFMDGEGNLAGARIYDPSSKEDKKEVNTIYNNMGYADLFIGAGQMPLGSPDNPRVVDLVSSLDARGVASVAQIAQATGVVPDDVKSFIKGSLVNANNDVRTYGAELLDELSVTAPRALQQAGFTEAQTLEAKEYNRLKKAGLPANDIQKRLEQTFNPLDKTIIDKRQQDISKGTVKPSRDVTENFGWGIDFTGMTEPELPIHAEVAAVIETEYQSVWNDYYTMTGNADLADEKASDWAKRTYAVSEVAGSPTLMKHAPEVAVGLPMLINPRTGENKNSEWQQRQLLEAVKTETNREDIDADNIILQSDILTEKAIRQGVAPSYGLYLKEGDEIVPLYKRMVFDPKTAQAELTSEELGKRKPPAKPKFGKNR